VIRIVVVVVVVEVVVLLIAKGVGEGVMIEDAYLANCTN